MPTHGNLDYAGLDPDEEWTEPTLHGTSDDDFGVSRDRQWDELPRADRAEVADNYLLGSADADNFTDLNLPVVDPEGDLDPSDDQLSKKGLLAADQRAMQVQGSSEDEKRRADEAANKLLAEEFGVE